MVAIGDRGKQLEVPYEEHHFGAVQILPCYKQIEVVLARQYRMDASAAFPITIGNFVPSKVIEDGLENRQG